MILMYHGVGTSEVDPWSLFVDSPNFADHLRVINECGTAMPLDDLAAAHKAGSVPDRAIAVTFDDGYLNNLTEAEPILSSHGVPATVYAIANPITERREFWWDELGALILQPRELPEVIQLSEANPAIETGVARSYSRAEFIADHDYREGVGEPSKRIALYTKIWDQLMPMEDNARKAALDQLAQTLGVEQSHRPNYRPVTEDELIDLDGTIVSVGAHTMSHPLLPGLSPEDQLQEIASSKSYLEQVLGRRVPAFSYPFGGRNKTTIDAVQEAGFDSACSTFQETLSSANDAYELPRFDVKNWSGEEFERRINQWFRYV